MRNAKKYNHPYFKCRKSFCTQSGLLNQTLCAKPNKHHPLRTLVWHARHLGYRALIAMMSERGIDMARDKRLGVGRRATSLESEKRCSRQARAVDSPGESMGRCEG